MLAERLLGVIFWLAGAVALTMASLPQPPELPGNPSDKVLHALAFFTLGAFAVFAFPRTKILFLFFSLGIFGGLIELIQTIPSLGREASLLDWLTDLGAAGLALLIAGPIRSWCVACKLDHGQPGEN